MTKYSLIQGCSAQLLLRQPCTRHRPSGAASAQKEPAPSLIKPETFDSGRALSGGSGSSHRALEASERKRMSGTAPAALPGTHRTAAGRHLPVPAREREAGRPLGPPEGGQLAPQGRGPRSHRPGRSSSHRAEEEKQPSRDPGHSGR